MNDKILTHKLYLFNDMLHINKHFSQTGFVYITRKHIIEDITEKWIRPNTFGYITKYAIFFHKQFTHISLTLYGPNRPFTSLTRFSGHSLR